VLSGRAAEFEAEFPFGVLGDALDEWLAALEHDRLAALSNGFAAELSSARRPSNVTSRASSTRSACRAAPS